MNFHPISNRYIQIGVHMRKKTISQSSTLLAFLCIISIIIQFATYYFFEMDAIFLVVTALSTLICTHIILEKTVNYETCFVYSLILVFFSLVVAVLLYSHPDIEFLPFSYALFGAILINWFVPCIYSFIRHMLDTGPRYDGYWQYFRNNSILFLIFYLTGFVCTFFLDLSFQEQCFSNERTVYIPFLQLITYIKNYLNHTITINRLLYYILIRTLVYLPIGYFIKLLIRKKKKGLKLFLFLLFPAIVEGLQYFLFHDYMSVDDVLYGMIGCFIGLFLFSIQSGMYRLAQGQDFLTREKSRPYYSSRIY